MLAELIEKDLKSARVLVVEDDQVMLDLIKETLHSIGIETVSAAKDGVQAWRKFEEGEHFDLVICDWVMPGMDGLQVLKNIRAGHSAIPFILVTVRSSEEDVKRATDCGVNAFVRKPFGSPELASEVSRVLKASDFRTGKRDPEAWEL